MAPVIGVTATLKEDTESTATRPLGTFVRADLDYVSGVEQAGGIPVVLPPVAGDPEAAAGAMLSGLDGLLLSGGSDLHPGYYGEEPLPGLDATLSERDAFETVLLEHALRRGMPVFGICRGLQLINVALGGTLYQDLPSQAEGELLDHRQTTPKWVPKHEVEFVPGSTVGEITGHARIKVNSYHHQAIKDLAPGLTATARAGDGVVEAVEARELSSERWLLGVQWHAEAMRGPARDGAAHRSLFEAHVAAAERHAGRRMAA
ncbi:MAG: gamma-glutamyl-gamma-aminobutyrate hydrolase family protein [Rubrobacter sp.]|nr:gamma-glutamyl-gamma-aminobutyrate hydrolase family protein [Rubrobacter sp.]